MMTCHPPTGVTRQNRHVDRLPHGYTNFTRFIAADHIEKRYDGAEPWSNARVELACLTAIRETFLFLWSLKVTCPSLAL